MKFNQLLQNIVPDMEDMAVEVTGLAVDSRQCQPGNVFCACPGHQTHGGDFIEQALQQPLAAVLVDADYAVLPAVADIATQRQIPIIMLPELTQQLSLLAERFFNLAQYDVPIVAVTGTNGKTSISHFFMQAMRQLNYQCGVIGTTGYGFETELLETELTTPDIFTLYQRIATLCQQGADYIAMEASSHALQQGRLGQLAIDTAIYTNLTPDHLDYHENFSSYAQAKRLLFLQKGLTKAIINADDEIGLQFINEFSQDLSVVAFSRKKRKLSADIPVVYAENVMISAKGISAKIISPWGQGVLQAPVLGEFNLENLLAVLAALIHFEVPFAKALTVLSHVHGICGRMQSLGGGNEPLIIVDFAHTPDALAKALIALRQHKPRQLWCVFGCGGCRDKEKRPLMGEVAEKYADVIVLTNDNPRQEQPEDIVDHIQQGIVDNQQVHVELDRQQAIAYAIAQAGSDDIILVAGKGHETYQQIGDEKIPMHDQTIIKELLQ